jgi:uncharacterized protein (TIGR03067 family)
MTWLAKLLNVLPPTLGLVLLAGGAAPATFADGGPPPDAETTADLKLLEKEQLARLGGDWRVVKVERDGRERPGISRDYHLGFSRTALYLKPNPHEFLDPYFDFRIDPTTRPPSIDLTDGEGKHFRGIYRFDGGKLTLCWNTRGGPRPVAFAAEPGSGHHLVILTRSDWHLTRGKWALVAGEIDGAAMKEAEVKAFRLELRGSNLTLTTREGTLEGWDVIDEHDAPRRITITLERPKGRAEEKLAGVYETDGDRLRICVGPVDHPATDFTTKPGSGRRLYVLRRAP